MSNVNRFLGDTPFRVFLKLLIVSFLVGIVMSAFGWSPFDVLQWVQTQPCASGIWALQR